MGETALSVQEKDAPHLVGAKALSVEEKDAPHLVEVQALSVDEKNALHLVGVSALAANEELDVGKGKPKRKSRICKRCELGGGTKK